MNRTVDVRTDALANEVRVDVPFLDLRAPYLELRDEIDAALARVLASGWYLLGTEIAAFEAEFARFVGAEHCVGVANGLEALHLSLRALKIGPGDEVIVPSNTYIATWLAVSQVGATLIPVEPDEATYNMDPGQVEAAITPRTRAIMPVHLYGQPADIGAITSIAASRGLFVVEDAAQAQGAAFRGRRIGAFGDATAWSFYPGKNLGALGDAGAVTTDDADLAGALRVLRNYGSRVKYVNDVRGYNSRLDEVQAAVLRAKLPHLDGWNSRRARRAARYTSGLLDTSLILPHVPDWADPAWYVYVVRASDRDELRRGLRARGIETLIHYPIPPYRQEAYSDLTLRASGFPVADRIHQQVLSLPMGPHLTDEQQERVIDALVTLRPR